MGATQRSNKQLLSLSPQPPASVDDSPTSKNIDRRRPMVCVRTRVQPGYRATTALNEPSVGARTHGRDNACVCNCVRACVRARVSVPVVVAITPTRSRLVPLDREQ